jgi:hypothetical protein
MAVIVSSVLVLPFMILELANRPLENFPIPLFAVLWLLPLAVTLTLTPIVRAARAGARIAANPFGLLVRVAFVGLAVWLWGGIVLDQMPCFLGVPNCD